MAPTKKRARYAPLIAQLPDKARTSMPEGGAAALSFPGGAIFDILSRVPVKSVCRFRCVCKDWLALVSEPGFVVKHKSRAAPEQLLVGTYCDCEVVPPYNSGMLVMDMEGKMLWTIKGLGPLPILYSSLDNLVVCFSGPDAITRVVDVTTGKVLVTCRLEPGGISNSKPYDISISLGRAAVSNSTKVVRLTEYSPCQPQQTCQVLTLGVPDAVWRQAPLPPSAVRVFSDQSSSATVNGVVHFLSSNYVIPHKPEDTVLCFDLETEEWSKTIQGPLNEDRELWSKTDQVRLSELKKTLCMIQTEECEANHLCTNLWLLVDADSSIWIKAYTVPMAKPFYMIEPLTVMPDGVKLLLSYRPTNMEETVLRVYDPSVGTCTDPMKLPENTFHRIGVCNLHLNCFVPPARSNGSRAESTFNMRMGSLDACH